LVGGGGPPGSRGGAPPQLGLVKVWFVKARSLKSVLVKKRQIKEAI